MRTTPELRQSDNGVYYIHWSEEVGGRMRTKRRSTGTRDYGEAVNALSVFLSSDVVDFRAAAKTKTVAEVCDAYLRMHAHPRGNTTEINNLRAPIAHFGNWPADGIKDADVENYQRKRQAGQYGRKPASSATVRREIVALQAAINFGIRKGLVRGMTECRLPKPAQGPRRERWLTEEQQVEVMEGLAAEDVCTRLYARLGLTYGVRKGAMMGLRLGPQIDWHANTIDFNEPGRRENRKRRPSVPMTESVRAEIEQVYAEKGDGQPVFDRATPARFERCMDRLGYDWVTSHVMKHTAITSLLRAGVAPDKVSRLTATEISTIFRVYRHHTNNELLEVASSRGFL